MLSLSRRYFCTIQSRKVNKLIVQLGNLTFGAIIGVGVLVVIGLVYIWSGVTTIQPATSESWHLPDINADLPEGREGNKIRYGYLLVSETPKWMGPTASSPELRFAGNNLACKNCHLESGTKPGSGSFVGVYNRFPQFRGREGKMGTLEDRINGCMERSMNGTALPIESPQMEAIVAYMKWLSEDVPPSVEKHYQGYMSYTIPDGAADPVKGKIIYDRECITCHMADGQGVRMAGADSLKGYLYPPLWGQDSYNHGAGMHRVITAAQFIKGNMPLGVTMEAPRLPDEEAFHVAAYIDSFDRPQKANAEVDFPDKKLKPMSTPYGPWEDPFTPEQHKYGPFAPIRDYYKKEYGIDKNK